MSPKEIKALIKTLRAAGVLHYKSPELELHLAPEGPTPPSPGLVAAPVPDITPEEEQEIKHTIEEMKSVLTISDNDLVERLWPLPKEEEAEL